MDAISKIVIAAAARPAGSRPVIWRDHWERGLPAARQSR